MTEVTRILGASVGNPDLKYVELPAPVLRKGMIDSGSLSPNAADLLIATNRGIGSRWIKAEVHSRANSTPTTLEELATTTFAPAFRAAPDASFSDRLSGTFLRSFLFRTGHRAA